MLHHWVVHKIFFLRKALSNNKNKDKSVVPSSSELSDLSDLDEPKKAKKKIKQKKSKALLNHLMKKLIHRQREIN
jgi:hypothetical protein